MRGVLLLLLIGCGPSNEEIELAASDLINEVLTLPQTCTDDRDCVFVGVSGSCYDRCFAVITVANVPYLEATQREVEDTLCVDYTGSYIRPPCLPPGEAVCTEENICGEASE